MNSNKNEDDLKKRIESAFIKKENDTKSNIKQISVSGTFSRIGTELLAGLLVGAGFGWTLDQWLSTKPFFLIIFFLLGGAAGLLNLWRIVSGKGLKIGYFK